MTRLILAFLCTASLAMPACASLDEASFSNEASCSTKNTDWAIGKTADPATGRKLFQQSGAGLWRIISPEKVVPADSRPDRLNIHVDGSNKITAVRCG